MKKLPVNNAVFEDIINNNYIYIDKTEYIYKLIDFGKQYFLSRPRRFGKSMLVSTLENIFKGRKELFKNLYIYDKLDWKVYPVIKISFLNLAYSTPEELKVSLYGMVLEVAKLYEISINNKNYKSAFTELIKKLSKIEQVIILIDEYDKPLIDYIENTDQSNKNREILKTFYSTIKGCEEYLKFVFITGVSKFSQTSLFSDLNNLNDITINDKYNG
ncbi:MAG TPA: AAA family ATPase, partial [bacterium]|nr:AAA family ATPase [bacterium]